MKRADGDCLQGLGWLSFKNVFLNEYQKILRLYAKYTCSLNINCPGVISVVATIHLKHSTMGKEQKGNLRCF